MRTLIISSLALSIAGAIAPQAAVIQGGASRTPVRVPTDLGPRSVRPITIAPIRLVNPGPVGTIFKGAPPVVPLGGTSLPTVGGLNPGIHAVGPVPVPASPPRYVQPTIGPVLVTPPKPLPTTPPRPLPMTPPRPLVEPTILLPGSSGSGHSALKSILEVGSNF